MMKSIQNKIVKQIERLCEKQYRKGFQHGYYAALEKTLSEEEVNVFRLKGMLDEYSNVVHPHTGRKENATERLLFESAMPNMSELINLLQKRNLPLKKTP
jgi:flagellar biosynthesis/type III secretory pathway protein FliH